MRRSSIRPRATPRLGVSAARAGKARQGRRAAAQAKARARITYIPPRSPLASPSRKASPPKANRLPRQAPQQSRDPNHLTYTPTRGLAFYLYDTPGGYMHYNYWLNQAGNLVLASPTSPDAGGALEYSCAQVGHAPVEGGAVAPPFPFPTCSGAADRKIT